jgi:competence protein ComFB
MAIRNIMEDVVYSTIDEILKEEKILAGAHKYKQDVAAYVLNRIPPKYITSERGILHGKLESRFLFQQKTDIIMLIHEAVDVIKSRRDTPTSSISSSALAKNLFFPHIIGEVLEETTFSVIAEVEVTLMHNGSQATMVDNSWDNPYVTNKGTLGYYHFWPEVRPDTMDISKEILFSIHFVHKNFKLATTDITIPVSSEFSISQSRAVPIILMQLKDGIDISFLYE